MKEEKAYDFSDLRPDPHRRLIEINANRFPITLVLDRLLEPANVGMLFRLGEACRIERIIFWKMESTEPSKKAVKVARAAVQQIPFLHVHTVRALQEALPDTHWVALEYTNRSIPYHQFRIPESLALFVGNEQRGLDPELLTLARESIHLPMYGLNTSINVACATSVALYRIAQQFAQKGNSLS
ncbi:MAG: TrmH family RNA methyltransferase [Bacteroidota bacterium]